MRMNKFESPQFGMSLTLSSMGTLKVTPQRHADSHPMGPNSP